MATAVNNNHSAVARHSTASNSSAAASSVARRGLSSPPSLLNARLFARLSAGYAQEQKMAQLRAAYASPLPGPAAANSSSCSTTPKAKAADPRRSAPTRASLPTATEPLGGIVGGAGDIFGERRNTNGQPSSTCSSRRGSAVANCLPTPSIMELAASAGLLSLSPSDLVFESSVLGIAYYDFILSVSEVVSTGGSASSCSSSTTTIKENANANNNKSAQASPAKRRVCNTGSEPTAGTTKEEKGPAMVFKAADKQRPGTSMGIEGRKGSAVSQQPSPPLDSNRPASAATASADATQSGASSAASSTFSNCQYRLFLAKLDSHTNVEWFESVIVPGDLLERNGIPVNELSLLTMGILVWRSRMGNSRLLCLVNGQLGDDSTTALEALKRAAGKYKCMHHVLTIGQRRQSASSTHSSCSTSSFRSSSSSSSFGQGQQDAGMKLRVLMCQSRCELSELPAQALRDAKFLMAPSTNPLLCLCFPLT